MARVRPAGRERREADYTAAAVLRPLLSEIAAALGAGVKIPPDAPVPNDIAATMTSLAPEGQLAKRLERQTQDLADTFSLPLRARLLHVNRALKALSKGSGAAEAVTWADAVKVTSELQNPDSELAKQWLRAATMLQDLISELDWVDHKVTRELERAGRGHAS